MSRELELEIRYAKSQGWVEVKPTLLTFQGRSFRKGVTRIWEIRRGWQVADLIDGYYVNHRPTDTLTSAVDNK